MNERVGKCTSSSEHRWSLSISLLGNKLSIMARCVWQECETTIGENEIETLLNATGMLSAKDAMIASYGEEHHIMEALRAYADAREGKHYKVSLTVDNDDFVWTSQEE